MKSSAWIRGYMDSPHHTRSSDASEPPSKQAHTSHSSQSASTSATEPVVVSDGSAIVNDIVEPSNSNNIAANEAREHGGRKGGIPPKANPNLSPAALKTLISRIPDQKLQSVSAPATFLPRCSIPQKTKQSITGGEFVEFDSLLLENSYLNVSDLPRLSISFEF